MPAGGALLQRPLQLGVGSCAGDDVCSGKQRKLGRTVESTSDPIDEDPTRPGAHLAPGDQHVPQAVPRNPGPLPTQLSFVAQTAQSARVPGSHQAPHRFRAC